jgi:glycolate oxidase FAD binding subunit
VETAAPATLDELSAALRDTVPAPVVVKGGQTKATWGGQSPPPEVVVDMGGLGRVVEHAAGDFVVTVQAGARLADVQRTVAAAGQWLALDPPEPDATVGGVISTAVSGPRRLRFGPPRDLLIGVTLVLADGTIARSGGKVVKNVAGYDLGKLFCGAFGTLGVVAECTLRLHPRPRATRTVSVPLDDPGEAVRALRRSALRPSAIEYDGERLHVVVETFEVAADAQAEQVVGVVGGEPHDGLPTGFGARPWQPGEVGLKATFRIGALSDVVALARRVAPSMRLSTHAASGVLWLGGACDVATVERLRAGVAGYDGTVVVVDAPVAMKSAIDVWGPMRGAAVMQRIKEQFDPTNRMNPGVMDVR